MVEPNSSESLTAATRADLNNLWAKAATVKGPPAETTTGQFLALGVNFRIDLIASFKAAFVTAKAVIKGTAAAHMPFDLIAWVEVGLETVEAIRSIFAALVERMRPIDYVTSVILANNEGGMTEEELRAAVGAFLNDPRAADYAWYLSMTGETIRRAKEVLADPKWLEKSLEQLKKDEFIERAGDRVVFRSRHFTLGWKAD